MFKLSYSRTLKNINLSSCRRAFADFYNIRHASECKIDVTPSTGMVDETVAIRLRGFKPKQMVTLVARVKEKEHVFESMCVYQADANGQTDNFSGISVAGTFTGKEPMGLFWSMKPLSGDTIRLIKTNVTTPMTYNIKAYPGLHTTTPISLCQPVAEANVMRLYKKPEVKRIQLTGKYEGVVFLPEGEDPFPGLIDMNGGFVRLKESRAALLASHGYATLALSFRSKKGTPDLSEFTTVKDACEWFTEQKYIQKDRLGSIGTCYGGFLSLFLASLKPQIRAVVNLNGVSVIPGPDFLDKCSPGWPSSDGTYLTEEGIDCRNCYECAHPFAVQAWKHGAKVLTIVGEDDRQVDPKWMTFTYDKCPEQFKENVTVYRYPGAGHVINPPYTPLSRTVSLRRELARSVSLIPEQFHGEDVLMGGWSKAHAYAQEDSWEKILNFLEKHLKNAI